MENNSACAVSQNSEISANGDKTEYRFPIFSEQPYLADHNVGQPLFGTTMSLEAMAEAVWQKWEKLPFLLTDICMGDDCLVPGEKENLRCKIALISEQVVKTKLYKGDTMLFTCNMSLKNEMSLLQVKKPDIQGKVITSEQVYQTFFHGAAFQVIQSAWKDCYDMIAVLSTPLQPLLMNRNYKMILPARIIEFCLQTSGVLDLTSKKVMSIPLHIDAIYIFKNNVQPEGI